MAENVKITIQTGLNEVADYLRENGYDVCVMGNCKGGADISIVDVPDSDWEEMGSAECRIDGENEMLVINAAKYTKEEILNLVKNNMCKKPANWFEG
ncbi:MAG: hypothetical protein GT589_00760 [Peptoclostridium sp.]|uniref:YkuS family protein n=1 Tax=Peptoclostridium sp. TaxID=1904860 RepID=UPI00139B0274|nr:YkuS family protein [Peptoclostridium sp.]MZQ74675.1 hypothetical protein [Peptoclostridium sp.]